jgi:hypothetical protein
VDLRSWGHFRACFAIAQIARQIASTGLTRGAPVCAWQESDRPQPCFRNVTAEASFTTILESTRKRFALPSCLVAGCDSATQTPRRSRDDELPKQQHAYERTAREHEACEQITHAFCSRSIYE